MRANTRIKQSKLVAALGSAIAIGMGIGLAHAGGPIFTGPATAAIMISDGVHSFICMDNNGSCDTDPNTGSMDVMHPIDGWFVNVDTGLSKNVLGSANDPQMDLGYNVAYLAGSTPGDGTLTIEFSDTGFMPSPAAFLSEIGGTFKNGVTSITVADYASNTNSLFDLGTLLCTETFTKTSPYAGSCGGKYSGTTPYSLTEVITITDAHRTPGQSSGDHSLTEAPEPGTLLLMGVALAGLGFVSRRRGDQA